MDTTGKPADHGLTHRAEVFRSKLIEEFQIVETTSEQGRRKVPVFSTTDIINRDVMNEILSKAPDQMIKFKVYKRNLISSGYNIDRRLNLVANRKKLPYGVWANLVVEKLPDSNNIVVVVLNRFFILVDILTIIIFCIDIILKWIDGFYKFWKNTWNIVELMITIVTIASPILFSFVKDKTSTFAITAQRLNNFRILRLLKVIKIFSRLKIIVLTLLRTFQSLIFIMMLLLIVSYIYALIGLVSFQTSSQDCKPYRFSGCFHSFISTMVTLFQLFTLDQWYNIYLDVSKIINPVAVLFYILIWIAIGAFVFRSLIIGIMVINFQSLTTELTREKESVGKSEEMARLKRELSVEIVRHNYQLLQARMTVLDKDTDADREALMRSRNKEMIDMLITLEEKLSKAKWLLELHGLEERQD